MEPERILRTGDPEPSVALYQRRSRQIVLLLVCAVFAAIGVPALVSGSIGGIVFGVVVVGTFVGLGVGTLRALLGGRPALLIDRRGITVSGAAGAGLVPWSQVIGIEEWGQGRSSQSLMIIVRDRRAVLAAAGPVARQLMRANGWLSRSPVHIPVGGLPLTPPELIAEIAGFARLHG